MPLFSVVVPIYKVEDYLEKCVDSLLRQTFRDLEIILVDDGSPDNCGKICEEYAQKDVRVRVIHKENGGLVSARKAGAREATGDFVACVDGDDWVSLDYFERFARVIKEYDADVICSGHWHAFEDRNVSKPCNLSAGFYDRCRIEENIYPFLIEGRDNAYFAPTLCGKAIRRDLYAFAQDKVDDRITIAEDFVCTRLCLDKAQSVFVLAECLYYYRQNPRSMTKRKYPLLWEKCELVFEFLNNYIDVSRFDFKNQLRRHITHHAFNVAVTQFYDHKPYREIVAGIRRKITQELYADAISNCEYKNGSKGHLAKIALKYRLYWLMWLYSRIK